MNILICNVGSTSLKYQLFDMDRAKRYSAPVALSVSVQQKACTITLITRPALPSVWMLCFPPTERPLRP